MRDDSSLGRRLMLLLGALAVIAPLRFLWQLRPPLPALTPSLSAPLTSAELEGFALLLAWLALVALVLSLLARMLQGLCGRRASAPASLGSRAERPRSRPSRRRPVASASGSHRWLGSAEPVVLAVTAPAEEVAERDGATPALAWPPERAAAASAAPDGRPVSISLLGPLLIVAIRRKRGLRSLTQELLAYLVLHPEGASREQLLDLLWPNDSPRRARQQRLSQSVADARRHLGEAFVAQGERYLLDRNRVWADVAEFERLRAEASSAAEPARELELLERALALVRGEPLAGSDYLWADGEVRRLRASVVELLDRLGRARLAAGDAPGALAAAERGLSFDSLKESLWRLALEAEGTLGLREAVMQRYDELRGLLDERLGLEPERETRALYLKLLGQG